MTSGLSLWRSAVPLFIAGGYVVCVCLHSAGLTGQMLYNNIFQLLRNHILFLFLSKREMTTSTGGCVVYI